MSERESPSTPRVTGAAVVAMLAVVTGLAAVVIAIGAIMIARDATDVAEDAERRADLAIERQRRMARFDGVSARPDDPRSMFLASSADRGDRLDEGLEQWGSYYERYKSAQPEVQYRAFTDFFDAYPLTVEYFFFVTREEIQRNDSLPLSPIDRERYDAFRYWQSLRISMSP